MFPPYIIPELASTTCKFSIHSICVLFPPFIIPKLASAEFKFSIHSICALYLAVSQLCQTIKVPSVLENPGKLLNILDFVADCTTRKLTVNAFAIFFENVWVY